MTYKAKPQSSGVGTFANNDVLATFSINNGAEWGLRLAVGTTANFTNIKFQHSVDGTVWTDVATFAQDGSANEAYVLIGRTVETAADTFTNNLEGLLPLKPKGRIIATGDITTTYCYVVSDA